MKTFSFVIGAFCVLAGWGVPSIAQVRPGEKHVTYPTKPIRMIIPQAPGGNTDFIGRQVSDYFSQALSYPVIVDNRPGAGGNVGNEIAAQAQADGYTLLTASPAFVTGPALYANLAYDAIKDFSPIGITALVPPSAGRAPFSCRK